MSETVTYGWTEVAQLTDNPVASIFPAGIVPAVPGTVRLSEPPLSHPVINVSPDPIAVYPVPNERADEKT
jgi:hypothetical protein